MALDERSVQVFLTEKGKALKEKASSVPLSMRQCMTLDEGEAKELYRLLYKILS
jgi:DNA-binding MarR family transcriptional regulator